MTDSFDPAVVADLDATAMLAKGEDPLQAILTAAEALPPGKVLHVRSPFEPMPLYQVMAERGFEHRSSQFGEQDWSSWFWHAEHPPEAARSVEPLAPAPEGVMDLRHLSPPEPLLWILEATAGSKEPIRMMLRCFPTPLVEMLEPQGWTVREESAGPDGVVVTVRRTETGER
jgi:hypothetical protein